MSALDVDPHHDQEGESGAMSEPTNDELIGLIRDGIGSPYSGVGEAMRAIDTLEGRIEAAEAELAQLKVNFEKRIENARRAYDACRESLEIEAGNYLRAEAELARWREVCGHPAVIVGVEVNRIVVMTNLHRSRHAHGDLNAIDAFLALVKSEGADPQ